MDDPKELLLPNVEPASFGDIIYVLTNAAMPKLIKIGRTSGEGVEKRVFDLSRASGVPVPFVVAVARRVEDAGKIERALHFAFGPHRINPRREFFEVEPERVRALIDVLPGQDITPQVKVATERETERAEPGSVSAGRNLERQRRPPLNFVEMGVPIGSELIHSDTGATATVVEPRKVMFRGAKVSLTAAQQAATDAIYAVAPGPHWTHGGRTISDYYEAWQGPRDEE